MLLLCSLDALAEDIELAPGLSLSVPDNLSLTSYPSDQLGGDIVMQGQLGGEPGYFASGLPIQRLGSNRSLWKRLEAKLRDRSLQGRLRLMRRGRFTTQEALPVYYRIYRYPNEDRWQQQLYFLVRNQNRAYWVYWVAVPSVSMDTVLPVAKHLMARVEIFGDSSGHTND